MRDEIWKDIEGYEGLYQVSSEGRVRSLGRTVKSCYNSFQTIKTRILSLCKNCRGYYIVGLSKDGESKSYSVHRLVAEAFLPNPNNYPCVNHKDEDKTNNCVDNLEWCTVKYNCNYGTGIERMIKNRTDKKKVNQYTTDGVFVKSFCSLQAAARELNAKEGNISSACSGKRKSAYGFLWRYAD